MSGTVKQFVDYSNNTANDTGEANTGSIQPVADGNPANAASIGRPDESLRQRTEAVRNTLSDTLFLRDSDRVLILTGPGKVTWPGSTTVSASGVPTLSDILHLLPMLTPGFAQTAPLPPVASAFGTLSLKRADSTNAILVTSQRRSYASGDQINIDVIAGGSFSCTLDVETGYQRTIHIVATGATQLSTVITALNALTPSAPDNTALLTAALEGGAVGTDLILTTQAKQFVTGNYDGEGHTITPANLQAFFTGNPTQALAEGDTLCIAFAMVSDTTTTGGRRQATPENANTAVPVGSFFNSRVHPDLLVNALPICKVVNGSLVFGTGAEIAAGSFSAPLTATNVGSSIVRNPGFEHGVTTDTSRYGISDWENRSDLALNGAFRVNTTTPYTGAKQLEFNQTSTSAATGRIEQEQEIPVLAGQSVIVAIAVRQLIAPTAGGYSVVLYWGDANSAAASSTAVALQVLSTTDAGYRTVSQVVTVPSGKFFLKMVTVEVVAVTLGSTGVSVLFDDLQVIVTTLAGTTPAANNRHLGTFLTGAAVFEDPTSYSLGQLATVAHYDRTTPASEGTLTFERKDLNYGGGNLPPALGLLGRLLNVGSKLLGSTANRLKARFSAPFSSAGSAVTLLWESLSDAGTGVNARGYVTASGEMMFTVNAFFDGTNWNKDLAGTLATQYMLRAGFIDQYGRDSDTAWTTWTRVSSSALAQTTLLASPNFAPLLRVFDVDGNMRTIVDHNGLPGGLASVIRQEWLSGDASSSSSPDGWSLSISGTGLAKVHTTAPQGLLLSVATTSDAAQAATLNFLFPNVTFAPADDTIAVLEWVIENGTGLGIGSVGVQMGFKSGAPTSACYISNAVGTTANWQFTIFGGGTSTNTDTGVAISSALTRFRIEMYGVNKTGGLRYLAYINGVLVAQYLAAAANKPILPLALHFALASTSGAGSLILHPLVCKYMRYPSDFAL